MIKLDKHPMFIGRISYVVLSIRTYLMPFWCLLMDLSLTRFVKNLKIHNFGGNNA